MKSIVAAVLLSSLAVTVYAEQAKTNKAVDLQKEPVASAAKVAALPQGAMVDVAEKKGFWVKVSGNGQTGWLKLSDIELQITKAKTDALATGRGGSGNIVNTAGARGLSPDELKTAKPNVGAVDAAAKASGSVSESDVEGFVKAGSISARANIPKTTLGKNTKSVPSTVTVSNGKPVQSGGKKNENW